MNNRGLGYELPLTGGVTDFLQVMLYCMPTKCLET